LHLELTDRGACERLRDWDLSGVLV
jgi:hypothetical protein